MVSCSRHEFVAVRIVLKLNIISWNIRHLRMEKVNTYIAQILEQVDTGHVMFFYENKCSNDMGRAFVNAIGTPLTKSAGAGSMRLTWKAHAYAVGTNEFVWIVWSNQCTTGPRSRTGAGQPFTIQLTPQHSEDGPLREWGAKALKSSLNATILSNLSVGRGKFRTPAVVHLTITKPDGTTKTIRIASWHAPGPAQGSAPLLNYYFQTALKNKIDLFIGDFNMTGLDTETSRVSLPLTLHRTNQSTTITASGPVAHEEGLDLVYIDAARIAPGLIVGGNQIGAAVVSVLPKPASMSYQEAFDLSDHLPILVRLKRL